MSRRTVSRRGPAASRTPQQPRPALTHFLCIPLVTQTSRPALESALRSFKDVVTAANRSASARELIPIPSIRPVDTLHLTLGVMSLDDAQLAEAKAHLHSLDLVTLLQAAKHKSVGTSQQDGPDSLDISLSSLIPMHDANKTSILYAQPKDESGCLHSFAEALRDSFLDKKLMVNDTRPLLLHATVLNTIYAKAQLGFVKKVDASMLLGQMSTFVWASCITIESINICQMGAKKVLDEDGNVVSEAYEVVAEVKF